MKCGVCSATDGFKYCKYLDSIGRVVTRQYCPACGGFIGQLLKSSVADGCGYELEFKSGDTTEFKIKEVIHKLRGEYKKHDHGNMALIKTQHNEYTSYRLVCEECLSVIINYVPDYFVSYCQSSNNEFLKKLINDCKELTEDGFYKKYALKIPKEVFSEYTLYLTTDKWNRKKQNRLALDQHQCRLCFSLDNLQVHHMTYDRLFDENFSDLLTVCKSCHETIHGRKFNDINL